MLVSDAQPYPTFDVKLGARAEELVERIYSFVVAAPGMPGGARIEGMRLASIHDVEHAADDTFLARPLIEGDQSNVRIIRLAAGQALPPHRHGTSDLMLYVVDGQGELDTPEGRLPFGAGQLAFYTAAEELKVQNHSTAEMTLLAFLSPKFAAR
jgi:quercetin dioxygenase-like cupin family protein